MHLSDNKGRFHLYSDTSRHAKLIAYASKRLHEAAKNYSITELEMCGLAINIVIFAHLLKRVDFDAIVDNLALVHILKSKTKPARTGIKKIIRSVEYVFIQCVLHERQR